LSVVAAVLFWATIALYGLAGVLYLGFLFGWKMPLVARAALTLGFLLHMLEIGARGVTGQHPVTSVGDAVGFLAWIMVGAFLLAQLRWGLEAVGTFVAPAAIVLLMAAYLSPKDVAPLPGLGVLGRVHISLALVGVSLFALATALAVFYLVEERQLKNKQLGGVVRRGVALETLDSLAHRCVQVGFPIFSVAVVTGALWSARREGGLARPEYAISMAAWGAFAGLLVARVTAGWRGRRAALVTIVGFVATLMVLGIYLFRHAAGA
jgi:ABC-type uncharacterized transport system permease subunit